MHPIKSIQARFIRPWKQRNFEKTKYGKLIARYKDAFKGKRCFIVANGPSLTAEDLNKLHQNGEYGHIHAAECTAAARHLPKVHLLEAELPDEQRHR